VGGRKPTDRYDAYKLYTLPKGRVTIHHALGPALWFSVYVYPSSESGRVMLRPKDAVEDWIPKVLAEAAMAPLPPPC
jgi:hypothetical protein